MAFLFSKTTRDVIRNRNLFQSISDITQKKKRGKTAPPELPNLSMHGMTPNGTYFFCNLVYQKNLTERKKIAIFNLIDAYANATNHAERVQLKSQIKEACGEQVDGIALLFSNASGTYGFVTGKRVKVARWGDFGPVELDADELFDDKTRPFKLSFQHFSFILEHEDDKTPGLILDYIRGDEEDDNINTDAINAIKFIDQLEEPFKHADLYLQTACAAIQDPALQQQVQAVYDALQLLSHDDKEIKYQATILTLQLLNAQSEEERQRLLNDYTELASKLYGSQIPNLMVVGISVFILSVAFLALAVVTAPAIPLYLLILCSCINMIASLVCATQGYNDFYNDEAKQRRSTANTLFDSKKNFKNMPLDLAPRKINAPDRDLSEEFGIKKTPKP